MSEEYGDQQKDKRNTDPLTGEAGAHPVGAGVGAAGGAMAGIVGGTAVAGPVGGLVGAIVGGVAGGYSGKAVGEGINPTEEDAYWRENHNPSEFDGAAYEDYAAAYRSGYEGYTSTLDSGRPFEDLESELRSKYEQAGSTVPWDKARGASRMAWDRASQQGPTRPSTPNL